MTDRDGAAAIDALVAAERLADAAKACLEAGDADRATSLYERAAAYGAAADAALQASQPVRALHLAALAADEALIVRAAAALDEQDAHGAALSLKARGHHAAAAQTLERAADWLAAAEAWGRAGELRRSALAYERAGDVVRAASALTEATRRAPSDSSASLALGQLLARLGRDDAAARALQRIGPAAPEHTEGQALLCDVLARLGVVERPPGSVVEVRVHPAGEAPATLLFGRYEVVRQIATTTTARVYLARDRLGGEVVVKLLRAGEMAGGRDAIARFEREARALASLRSSHVLPLLAFLPAGPAIVTPWMSGGSLADALRVGRVAPARAAEIACAVLSALTDAHRLGILHRDVKPSNILFDAGGAPHLGDFGAAHVDESATTVTAGLFGTMGYLSPEQLAGGSASVAGDLYAVGALLYEALTGLTPKSADDLTVLPSDVHVELDAEHDRVVRALLARDPSARPESAHEAARRIRALVWAPTLAPGSTPHGSEGCSSARGSARLVPDGARGAHDTMLGRPVMTAPAVSSTLALARAFARAGHDALATIYRADEVSGTVWAEAFDEGSLACGSPGLLPHHSAALRAALDALHEQGAAHGAVDLRHVFITEARGIVLAFPAAVEPDASRDHDNRAFDALFGRRRH